ALEDSVIVVSGASSGLGARLARVAHSAGADVVVAARREDRIQDLAEDLGERAAAVRCDVTVPADVEALVSTAIDRFGRIDVLVNSAGISIPMAAEDEPVEQFERVLGVNVVGTFRTCQAVGRHMLERGRGSIVNVASVLGMVAGAPMRQASYCASKGAVINLTRELGVQWARKGVRVNALAPGWFESEMTEGIWTDERSSDFITRNTPMARRGDAHELDTAFLFLASAGSSYMTGQVLTVDGGWTAR
ncbi:MAG TPA: glucose 1-dehydrogenase, partial [Acidimicrobiales bacterium]|nr:glucose 1-dehydrogenase [Acidimicrobiales bacterium]